MHSKKHVQALKALRREMLRDGVDFDLADLQEALPDLDGGGVEKGEAPPRSPSPPPPAWPPAGDPEPAEGEPASPAVPEEGTAPSKAEAAAASAAARLQRRLKRKEKQREQPKPPHPLPGGKGKGSTPGKAATMCAYCRQGFASRTKLFDHLRESGHAVLK